MCSKSIDAFGIILSVVILISSMGLSSDGKAQTINISDERTPHYSTDIDVSPQEPMVLDLSFPQGAPRLNQTAELRCALRAGSASSNNVTMNIKLPEGIQLVTGNLSARFGNISRNEVREIRAVIKPVRAGEYTIEAVRSFVPRSSSLQPGPGLFKVYLSISETSAEWKRYPFWVDKGITSGELVQTRVESSKPVPLTPQQKLAIETADKLRTPKPSAISPGGTQKKPQTDQHNSIGIYGYLKFKEDTGSDYRNNPTTAVAASTFWVELINATTGGYLLPYPYGMYTDTNGYFSSFTNFDPTQGFIVRMYTEVLYDGNHLLQVINPQGNVWKYNSGVFNIGDDGGNHNLGDLTVQSYDTVIGACWMKDDLDRAYRFQSNHPCGATIRWPSTCTPSPAHYHPQSGGEIHIWADAEKSKDVVVHEYGHCVMYNIYGGYWPSGDCTGHDIPVASNLGCAWKEGWAEFFALAVNNNAGFYYATGTLLNLENPTWGEPDWENGDTVEGRVAGALWDIYDPNSDGYDTYSLGYSDIWDTFSNQTDATLYEFYQAWCSRSHSQSAFRDCAYQNAIVWPGVTPPAPPLLSSPPNGSTQAGTSITFQWNASAGATNYFVEVHKVSDGSVKYANVVGNVLSYNDTGYPNNGTVYQWWVYAGNASGWGTPSTWTFTNGP